MKKTKPKAKPKPSAKTKPKAKPMPSVKTKPKAKPKPSAKPKPTPKRKPAPKVSRNSIKVLRKKHDILNRFEFKYENFFKYIKLIYNTLYKKLKKDRYIIYVQAVYSITIQSEDEYFQDSYISFLKYFHFTKKTTFENFQKKIKDIVNTYARKFLKEYKTEVATEKIIIIVLK
jgi:hypothetical protein